jgi:hypothetical protein
MLGGVRALLLSVVIAVGFVVAGCGGGGGKDAATGPEEQLAAAVKDFATLKSYHFTAVEIVDGLTTSYEGDVFASGEGRVTSDAGTGTGGVRVLVVGDVTYLKGSTEFWSVNFSGEVPEARAETLARRIGDRWIRMTAADGVDTSSLDDASPKRVLACVRATAGTLSRGRDMDVRGQKATVVQNAGDRPGTAPGYYALRKGERPRLLRFVQTGRATPGRSKVRRCSIGAGDTKATRIEMTFSAFDAAKPVTAPAHAAGLRELLPKSGEPAGAGAPAEPS